MKHLVYIFLFLALAAQADDLLPEGTQVEASPAAEEAKLAEPTPPASTSPTLALPVESPAAATSTAVSVSTATEVASPLAAEEKAAAAEEKPAGLEAPHEAPKELAAEPLDITAEQTAPPPVATPQINYGPSAEEGYGSVGLKNDGQFMEVGGDKKTEESASDEGDRKTSSLPENLE